MEEARGAMQKKYASAPLAGLEYSDKRKDTAGWQLSALSVALPNLIRPLHPTNDITLFLYYKYCAP
jgi:hypothetical protein